MTRRKNISDEERRERKREENKKYRESMSEEQKEHRRAYNRAWIAALSEERKERRNALTRVWNKANRDKRRENRKPRTEAEKLARKPMTPEQKVAKKAYDLAYMARLTDDERDERVARRKMNYAQNREALRARSQAERDNLHDSYVKKVLKCSVNPPPELIELKRVNLRIQRYLNNGEQK